MLHCGMSIGIQRGISNQHLVIIIQTTNKSLPGDADICLGEDAKSPPPNWSSTASHLFRQCLGLHRFISGDHLNISF